MTEIMKTSSEDALEQRKMSVKNFPKVENNTKISLERRKVGLNRTQHHMAFNTWQYPQNLREDLWEHNRMFRRMLIAQCTEYVRNEEILKEMKSKVLLYSH